MDQGPYKSPFRGNMLSKQNKGTFCFPKKCFLLFTILCTSDSIKNMSVEGRGMSRMSIWTDDGDNLKMSTVVHMIGEGIGTPNGTYLNFVRHSVTLIVIVRYKTMVIKTINPNQRLNSVLK